MEPGVDWDAYDFIDLGCSTGGSIRHCLKRFGAHAGIGVDASRQKVERTRQSGFPAVLGDARDLALHDQVRFVSMLDFFEHLPDLEAVEAVLASAARAATDFIYIKHPSFEGKETLEFAGVRQYWWHWRGHATHLRVSDYCSILDRLGLHQYMIRYLQRIDDSDHPSIIPTHQPIDTTEDEARTIKCEPRVHFCPPVWRRQDIFVALRAFDPEEWQEITKPTAQDRKLMGSLGAPSGAAAQGR